GHACAGESDAVADRGRAEPAGRCLDRQRVAERRADAERADLDDPADAADDAGEHGAIVLARGASRVAQASPADQAPGETDTGRSSSRRSAPTRSIAVNAKPSASSRRAS